jgi:prepilin signal peptidase PulO-like enzyme (type II secretory pathway)
MLYLFKIFNLWKIYYMSIILNILAGILAGTLINFFADVLPPSRRLSRPICPACGETTPLKDYLLLSPCPNCGQRRSLRAFVILGVSILLCIALYFFPFYTLSLWAALPVLVFLGVITVIDIEHRLVLFETTLFGIVLLLIYGISLHGLVNAVYGSLGGFAILLAIYLLSIGFSKLIGALRGKNIHGDVFGFGDVSAGVFLGLLTGWPAIAGAITIAFLVFAVFSMAYLLALVLTRQYRAFTRALPFAPFLILGAIAVFYL